MLAKTSRPRLSAAYQRSGLFDRLDIARRQHSATLVNGPPGAGKTTLVSSYLEFRNLRSLWYQVDSGDEDVATFFHYFSEAAKQHCSTHALPLPEFEPGNVSDLIRFSRQYFRAFYAGRDTPLVVVLDNYHELADDSPLHDVIQVACEEILEHCHLVIVTRNACPQSLFRKRCCDAVAIIGPDDLVLTPEETHCIAESKGIKLSSGAAALALQTRTAGWMMGLMLVIERARRNNTGPNLGLSLRDGQEEPLFDYFAGEVFRKLDVDCRELLMQIALLPKMTIHRVAQLTDTDKAGTLLRELMRKNLFVTHHGGTESAYQFHPLFREFLLDQGALHYLATDLTSLRCKAAEVLMEDGDDEAAIELLDQARSWKQMAEVILAAAPKLREQGRTATLDTWLKKLPADRISTNPWLLYWQANSKAFSDPAMSQQILEKAYERFSLTVDLTGMALSWAGLVETVLSMHRDYRQLDTWIAEFNERLEGRLGQLPAEIRARVTLAYFVALSFRQPRQADMSVWLERVRKLVESETGAAERPRLRQHLVTYHILRGEHAEAESVLSMLHYADDLPVSERPPRTAVDHINEANVALHAGMGERCMRAVTEGLCAAEGTGNRLLDSELLQLGAIMCLNRGDLDRTDKFLAAFERLAEAFPSVDCGAYYAVAAWRKFQAGESTLALQLFGRAVAASDSRGTPYYIAADNLGFGLLLHLCGKTSDGLRHLETGRKVGAGIKSSVLEYAYHLFSAYVALDLNREEKARTHLESGMRLGRKNGYMHFPFFPPRVIARLCFIALEAKIETVYVQALIERNQLTPDPAWRQSESWPWPIRIYTLGRFSVVMQGEALRFVGKAQKKPLELLKALIAFGGREVSEVKLADALWPEADGDAAAQALATTLFRLRKLLGEHVIRRQESRLTLDPAFCWVDCWAFERLSSDDSGDAPKRLAKLRQLHQGLFLEGADDAPWAQTMRQRLHARFSQLAGK